MKRARSFGGTQHRDIKRRKLASSVSFYVPTAENKDENEFPGSKLFDGSKVLIVSQGIGSVRYGILKNQLKQRKGKIHHRLHQSTTHIITILPPEKLLKVLNTSKIPDNIQIVAPEWISDSLRNQATLEEKKTLITLVQFPKPLPTPVQADEESNDLDSPKQRQTDPGLSPILTSLVKQENTPQKPTTMNLFNFKYSPITVSPIPLRSPKTAFPWMTPTKNCVSTHNELIEPEPNSIFGFASPEHNTSFDLTFHSPENSQSESDDEFIDKVQLLKSKALSDIPCEENEEENDEWLSYLPPSSSPIHNTKQMNVGGMNINHLACQKTVTVNKLVESNYNNKITKILKEMEILEKNLGEQWRALAYRRAIAALERLPYEITSEEQARKIRGVGEKIEKKIQEIIETGTLKRLANPDERTLAFQKLSKVWGAGPETIKKWLAQGFFTIEDLQANISSLNQQQQIGVRYYNEFLARIPRQEVKHIYERFKSIVVPLFPNLLIEICGSYRRGAKDCGDIDILLTHRKGEGSDGQLQKVVTTLHKEKFLTEDLSFGASDKYMGVCHIPAPCGSGIHRRIDIQFIPLDQWPLAILYFTGSAHFNRSMRLWARKNGYSLCEKSLKKRFVLAKGPAYRREKENDIKGDPITVKTERDVFEALGLSYIPPSQRNV